MIAIYGVATYDTDVYSVFPDMITGRTDGDYYNHSDLNRVETVFEYFENKLNIAYGFDLSLTTKTDWDNSDLGQLGAQALMETYRQNVVDIRTAINTVTEPPDSMRFLTAEEANNIEKILEEVEDILIRISQAWRYSGTINSGQEGLI